MRARYTSLIPCQGLPLLIITLHSPPLTIILQRVLWISPGVRQLRELRAGRLREFREVSVCDHPLQGEVHRDPSADLLHDDPHLSRRYRLLRGHLLHLRHQLGVQHLLQRHGGRV